MAILLLAFATGAWPAAAAPRDDPGLERIRSLYLAAVGDAAAIDRGLREVESVREKARAREGSRLDGVLDAYRGALVTLRAKHALWPPTKLRHLRDGLRVLDDAVADHPAVAEIRYLRLMSCYYLPSVLGRSGSVAEDFAALARLLPAERGEYPDSVYRAIVSFLLERGKLSPEERIPLENGVRG